MLAVDAQLRSWKHGAETFGPGELALEVRRLDPSALMPLLRSLPALSRPAETSAATAKLTPLAIMLARKAPEAEFTVLRLRKDADELTGRGRLLFDGRRLGANVPAGRLLTALSGEFELSVPVALARAWFLPTTPGTDDSKDGGGTTTRDEGGRAASGTAAESNAGSELSDDPAGAPKPNDWMTRLRRMKCCHRICTNIPTAGCSCRPKPVTGSRPRSNRDGCSSTTNPGNVQDVRVSRRAGARSDHGRASCQRLKNPLRQTRGARLCVSPRAKRNSLVLYRDARMSREGTTPRTREPYGHPSIPGVVRSRHVTHVYQALHDPCVSAPFPPSLSRQKIGRRVAPEGFTTEGVQSGYML